FFRTSQDLSCVVLQPINIVTFVFSCLGLLAGTLKFLMMWLDSRHASAIRQQTLTASTPDDTDNEKPDTLHPETELVAIGPGVPAEDEDHIATKTATAGGEAKRAVHFHVPVDVDTTEPA